MRQWPLRGEAALRCERTSVATRSSGSGARRRAPIREPKRWPSDVTTALWTTGPPVRRLVDDVDVVAAEDRGIGDAHIEMRR